MCLGVLLMILGAGADTSEPFLIQFKNYEVNRSRTDLSFLIQTVRGEVVDDSTSEFALHPSSRFFHLLKDAEDGVMPCLGSVHFYVDGKRHSALFVTYSGKEAIQSFLKAETSKRPAGKISGTDSEYRLSAPPVVVTESNVTRRTTYDDICYKFFDGVALIGSPAVFEFPIERLRKFIRDGRGLDLGTVIVMDAMPQATRDKIIRRQGTVWGVQQQRRDSEDGDSLDYLLRTAKFKTLERALQLALDDLVVVNSSVNLPRVDRSYRASLTLQFAANSASADLLRSLGLGRRSRQTLPANAVAWACVNAQIPEEVRMPLKAIMRSWIGESELQDIIQSTLDNRQLSCDLFLDSDGSAPYLKSRIRVDAAELDEATLTKSLGLEIGDHSNWMFDSFRSGGLVIWPSLSNGYLAATACYADDYPIKNVSEVDADETVSNPYLGEFFIDVARCNPRHERALSENVVTDALKFLEQRKPPPRRGPRGREQKDVNALDLLRLAASDQDWTAKGRIQVSRSGESVKIDFTVGQHLYAWLATTGLKSAFDLSGSSAAKPTIIQVK